MLNDVRVIGAQIQVAQIRMDKREPEEGVPHRATPRTSAVFINRATLISLLFVLAGCVDAVVYTPPQTPQGQRCSMQCAAEQTRCRQASDLAAQQACEQQADVDVSQCRAQANTAQQQCEMDADFEYNQCLGERAGAQPTGVPVSPACIRKACMPQAPCLQKSCLAQSGDHAFCDQDYDQCFNRCGGTIQVQKRRQIPLGR